MPAMVSFLANEVLRRVAMIAMIKTSPASVTMFMIAKYVQNAVWKYDQ